MHPYSRKVQTVVVNHSLMLHCFGTIGSCKPCMVSESEPCDTIARIVMAFKEMEKKG